MKFAIIGVAILLGLLGPTLADGSAMYTTTDLGKNYVMQEDPHGQVYGLMSTDTGVDYAFNKSPFTDINILSNFKIGQGFQALTMQDGGYQVGYSYYYSGTENGYHASFDDYNDGWYTRGTLSPVLDMNILGQVVGRSLKPNDVDSYAVFTDVGVKLHGFPSATSDDLNNYIATIPGVSLTSAVSIDDLGRILAYGSDGHAYLLTPDSLGTAATVPEPPAGAMLALGFCILGIKSIRSRSSRRPAAGRGQREKVSGTIFQHTRS